MSYDAHRREFRWRLPESFNFAADVVHRWAEDPAKLALLWCDASGREERYTFREIAQRSRRVGNLLRASGLRKGERCIVMLPRLPQWHIAMVGCLRVGVIPVPCIDMLTEKDVRYRAEHSGAAAAITTAANTAKFAGLTGLRLRAAVGGAPGWLDFDAAASAAPARCEPETLGMDDPVAIYYTSGIER